MGSALKFGFRGYELSFLSPVDRGAFKSLTSAPIRSGPLAQLVIASRALPGPRVALPAFADGTAPTGGSRDTNGEAADSEVHALRSMVADLFRAVALRIEEVLPPALVAARRAWDRADEVLIFDDGLRAAFFRARTLLHQAQQAPSITVRAVALESVLALRAVGTLLDLIEQRLVVLIRLQVRTFGPDLLPAGRPFLDIAAALTDAARRWS